MLAVSPLHTLNHANKKPNYFWQKKIPLYAIYIIKKRNPPILLASYHNLLLKYSDLERKKTS
jgi:hypothetical protein